jgi:ABC-2 type transport system ATP-binding protein
MFIGWVPELPIYEMDFRALDYFVYLAGYYGLSVGEARELGRKLLDEVGLGDALNKKLAEFSQGMKKRFALAVSMINNPPNFLFDEVLNGLDPQGIAFFRELAVKFRREGRAVLFSSHILSEVEGICDRVVFIHRGRIIGVYTMDEIRYRVSPAIEINLSKIDRDVFNILSKYGEPEVLNNNKVILRKPRSDTEVILSELVSRGIGVREVKRVEKSLEEFFFSLVKEAEEGR